MENQFLLLQQKWLYAFIERQIKDIYKTFLDILAEISQLEQTAAKKLVDQVPEAEPFAAFLSILDMEQFQRYRSKILDVSNDGLRSIKTEIAGKDIKPIKNLDVIQYKNE